MDQQLAVVYEPELKVIVVGFLARYGKATRPLYALSLRQFFEWCHQMGVSPLRVQRGHVEAWSRYLEEERGLKVSTIASKLNAICGRDGTRLKKGAMVRIINRLMKQCAIEKRITPHSFRHTFVTLSLKAGAPVHKVQQAGGWAAADMVMYYNRDEESLDGHVTQLLSSFVGLAS